MDTRRPEVIDDVAAMSSDSPTATMPTAAERGAAAATGSSLALWARSIPSVTAVTAPSGNRTFAELDANICRLARALDARGLATGDSVALVCSNRAEFAEVVHACLRTGLRYTPVNRHLTVEEIAYVVDDCEATALIGDAGFAEPMTAVAQRCPTTSVRLAIGGDISGFESYESALAEQSDAELDHPVLGNRMLYTSGTTGRPKGVLRPPNYSTGLDALISAPAYKAGTGQLNLCTGPLYHGGPLGYSLLMPLANGVGVVLMERFDADTALSLIEEHRITHTHMVPTMFHRMLRLPEEQRAAADVSSMRYIVHGAAPCPVQTKWAMIEWFGPILWEYFAATEGAGASIGPDEWMARPGSVGLPPGRNHVRIVDDAGTPCPPGQVGAIQLRRADGADFEYFGDPAKTAATHRGEYFAIGDIGYLDDDGYLFVTDRDADVIISGGVNIYPAEVESVLLSHPDVADAAVIGVPDVEFGERVVAVVQPADAASHDENTGDAIIEFCRERLAHFKCPRRVDLTDALPRSDNGKLYRNELRARYRNEATPQGTP